MRTLVDIKKKREDFYNSVKDISFKCGSGSKKEGMEEVIKYSCSRLYHAIAQRKKHSYQSESNKYLDKIYSIVALLKSDELFSEPKNDKTYSNFVTVKKHLQELSDALEGAGKAKFKITTVGAVLEYKPTQKKFIDLSKEVKELIKAYSKNDVLNETFYNAIKDISFTSNSKLKYFTDAVFTIGFGCEGLVKAILKIDYSEKSGIKKYLSDIYNNSEQLSGVIDYAKTKQCLAGLFNALEQSGKAKSSSTASGTVLSDEKINKKIVELAGEVKRIAKYYSGTFLEELSGYLGTMNFDFSKNDDEWDLIRKINKSCEHMYPIAKTWLCEISYDNKIHFNFLNSEIDYLCKFKKMDSIVIEVLTRLQKFFEEASHTKFVDSDLERFSSKIKEIASDLKKLVVHLKIYLADTSASTKSPSHNSKDK